MLTSKQKKVFLDEYIGSQDLSTEQRHQLKGLLLEDTHDGKLYKYRTFDANGYSLENLKNQSLYCAAPESFNDPFDCRVGVDLCSLIDNLFTKELEETRYKIESYVSSLFKEYESSDSIEKQMTDYLLSAPETMIEILKASCKNLQYEKVMELSFASLSIYLQELTSKGEQLHLDENSTFSDFIRNFGISEDLDELDLVNGFLAKFSSYNGTALETGTDIIKEMGKNMNQRMHDIINVGCLCTDYKNRLMWSHYADCHTGFCIEYDYGAVDFSKSLLYPLPVIYTDKRPKVPWKLFLNQKEGDVEKAVKEMTMVFLTKDIEWAYENEWRIIVPKQMEANVYLAPVSCIYLGAECSEGNKNKIMQIAKEINVSVKQMTIDRGEYQLHTQKVEEEF